MNIKPQREPFFFLPFIVFAVAVCFLVSLLYTIKNDVFYSGDGGLKFLMIKQISSGGSVATLNIQTPIWVKKIWLQGFYPFKEPFVYDSPGSKIVSFPPAFQWLTSAFYNWFGFRGIYIIPAISITILWIWFITVLRKAGVTPVLISISFFLLAFCSPLTIYSALFWEHSLASILSFSSVVYLMLKKVSALQACLLGILSGMSGWFRPEMLLLCMLFLTVIVINYFKNREKPAIIFVTATVAGIAAFFIFNQRIYGNILGAHSYQLLASESFAAYLKAKFIILFHLNGKLVIFFPLVVVFYICSYYLSFQKPTLPAWIYQLTGITILFLVMVPFVLPNGGGKQWGPRYLLPVIPMVITTLCFVVKDYDFKRPDKWIWSMLLLIVAYSLYLNVYLAHQNLRDDYAYHMKPGLDFLKSDTCEVLVVQNQYMAQEFASLFGKKNFFLAEGQESFDQLQQLLKAQGVDKVIFMCHNNKFKMLPRNLLGNSAELIKMGDYFFAEYSLR